MGNRNQIVGVCRFSYLGNGGFAASRKSPGDLAADLYDTDRMQRRLALFQSLTLPSLAAQSDPDFTLVVLIGDTMPVRWRRKLKALREEFAFLELCTLEPAGPLNATRRAFRRGTDPDARHVTGFRIDDDDAVAVDYIARTRAVAETLLDRGLAGADAPAVIAFHRGLYWDLNDRQTPFHDFRETQPLGLASAMVTSADPQVNIFRWNHRRLAAHVRCWSEPDEIMFIRTLHQHNDSDRAVPPGAEPIGGARARSLLRTRFGLDPRRVLPLMWRRRGAVAADDDG